jgi:hypothetical protein
MEASKARKHIFMGCFPEQLFFCFVLLMMRDGQSK